MTEMKPMFERETGKSSTAVAANTGLTDKKAASAR